MFLHFKNKEYRQNDWRNKLITHIPLKTYKTFRAEKDPIICYSIQALLYGYTIANNVFFSNGLREFGILPKYFLLFL